MKNKGITLIALIITIIILLILAAVTINVLIGDNGLFKTAKKAGESYQIAGIRETIEAEILAMDAEKISKGETLTIEQALVAIKQKGTFEEIDLDERTGIIQGYIVTLGYNENGKVVIKDIEKDIGTRIIITLNTEEYTKENIELEIGVKPEEINITNIEVPSTITKNEQGKYEVSQNGTYLIKVTLENGETLEKEIKIEQIDKLPPKNFTITAENTETGFIVSGETTDQEATGENASSGIERYEYIVTDENGTETTYNTNEITGLEPGKYQVYAIAYDKAGTPTTSNEVTVKYNYYEWNKYSCYAYKYRVTESNKEERQAYSPYALWTATLHTGETLDDVFDRVTGKFTFKSSTSNSSNTTGVCLNSFGIGVVLANADKTKVYVTEDGWARRSDTKTSVWMVENCVVYESYKSNSYEKGDTYYGIVTSSNSEEYPNKGYNEKDGYWYEKID